LSDSRESIAALWEEADGYPKQLSIAGIDPQRPLGFLVEVAKSLSYSNHPACPTIADGEHASNEDPAVIKWILVHPGQNVSFQEFAHVPDSWVPPQPD
jgi:hypothetical protein